MRKDRVADHVNAVEENHLLLEAALYEQVERPPCPYCCRPVEMVVRTETENNGWVVRSYRCRHCTHLWGLVYYWPEGGKIQQFIDHESLKKEIDHVRVRAWVHRQVDTVLPPGFTDGPAKDGPDGL